jgi:TolB-like protein
MGLIAELRRRNVLRMAGLYLVGAWLITQVAGTLLPMFDAPTWISRTVVILLAIGFIPALVFAWVFELTPQGLQRDTSEAAANPIAPQVARRMDRLLLLIFALALGYFAFDKFALAPRREAALVAQASGDASAARASQTKANPRSVAVLPFVNMSTDPENEFFSDGLAEEILNSLARIDGMQVVGRTSSFQFKGKNEDLRAIGEKLDVAAVLEGSVRREGERARITAQLVRTSDGIHIWSQTYDRTLKDTLAVQLDIAEQVAGVLDVVLDDAQRARMREAGVKNVDAFIAYQKGWKLYNDAHRKPGADLIDTLRLANVEFEKATQLEPSFSFAYFAETDLYEHILLSDGRAVEERIDAQRMALQTLKQAAATSPDAQQRELALAERQMLSDDWHDLAARIEGALKEPGCSAPNWMPVFASAFGFADLIEDLGARANACDPLNGINWSTRSWVARATGHPERVLALQAQAAKVLDSTRPSADPVVATVMLGRVDDARKMLQTMEKEGEGYYMAEVITGRAAGEDPASIHARLRSVDRSASRLKTWDIVDAVEAAQSGDRDAANRQAALLDARPAGGLLLAIVVTYCGCGAPFDLDATPNFKARLAESGLRWPPPRTIGEPGKADSAGR